MAELDLTGIQSGLTAVAQVGQAAASPFIKSQSGKNTEAVVLGETQLFIQALPALYGLFDSISALFKHTHAAVQAQAAQAQTKPVPVETPTVVTNG